METATEMALEQNFLNKSIAVGRPNTDLKVAAALMRAQEKFDPILKDTNNPFYKSKYATLDQVIAATRPHLRTENLVVLQANIQNGERHGVFTRLLHVESGEELGSELVAKPKEDTIQQIASILTYARRYEYLTILGLAPEDDDGSLASGTTRSQSEQPAAYSGPVKAVIPAPTPTVSNKTPNTPSIAFPAVSSVSTTVSAPVPQTKMVDSRPTPVQSTTLAGINAIPTPEQYADYVAKAITLLETLQKTAVKHELKPPTKLAFKKYLTRVGKVEKTEELTIGKWDVIFTEFEKLLAANPKQAVELIKEGANG